MDDASRAKQLALELEASFRNRADLYRLLLDELTLTLGADEAEALLIRAIEKRGSEVAASFRNFGRDQAREIGEAFLAVSPDGGRMYPTDVGRSIDGISFRVRRCPLKDAWRDAGVSDDKLQTLCHIAGAFDRGLFEATGICFTNRTWRVGDGDHCCEIHLTNAVEDKSSDGPA
ncbi:MAG: L-2-amino-thiazoline-4-carboxylic acid hydrolase [Rhizobiaceae bacterium]